MADQTPSSIETPTTPLARSWRVVVVLLGVAVLGASLIQVVRKSVGKLPSGALSARVHPATGVESIATLDSDGDGLFDTQEERLGTNPKNPDTDNDGFTDGEEVVNGYNPLSAAPAGALQNALPVFGEPLVISQAVTGGKAAASTASANTNSLPAIGGVNPNDVLDSSALTDILRQTGTALHYQLPEVPSGDILISPAAGKKPVEDYLLSLFGVFTKHTPFTNEQDIMRFVQEVQTNNFTRVGDVLKTKDAAYNDLKRIPVPAEVVPTHRQGLQMLLATIGVLDELRQSSNASDPTAALTVFSKAQLLIDQARTLSQSVYGLVKKYDLPFKFSPLD